MFPGVSTKSIPSRMHSRSVEVPSNWLGFSLSGAMKMGLESDGVLP
jgi:hypothetical protein